MGHQTQFSHHQGIQQHNPYGHQNFATYGSNPAQIGINNMNQYVNSKGQYKAYPINTVYQMQHPQQVFIRYTTDIHYFSLTNLTLSINLSLLFLTHSTLRVSFIRNYILIFIYNKYKYI